MQKAPQLMALSILASSHSAYGRNIHLIQFSDFFMSKFCITEEDEKSSEELCLSYIKYMIKKFPNYKSDLTSYFNSLPEEETENC